MVYFSLKSLPANQSSPSDVSVVLASESESFVWEVSATEEELSCSEEDLPPQAAVDSVKTRQNNSAISFLLRFNVFTILCCFDLLIKTSIRSQVI